MEQLLITGDGSPTIYNAALNETYHSRHGALAESRHVYIQAGLSKAVERFGNQLQLLEIGFGTGLNALLTLQECRKKQLLVHYTALEVSPVNPDLLDKLTYASLTGYPEDHELFLHLHRQPWNTVQDIEPSFVLDKRQLDVREFKEENPRYHIVFFDAFAPKIHPELWTADVFARVAKAMLPSGILVTYVCNSAVKKTLSEAGFTVEVILGPPGKREMLRAFFNA